MADNKIIKDLESCKSGKCANCGYCEYLGKDIINSKGLHVSCFHLLISDALDLINRQKAKIKESDEKIVIQKGLIDRQKAEIEKLCIEIDDLIIAKDLLFDEAEALIKKAKAEAIKEFAERLKGLLSLNVRVSNADYLDIATDIDELVKEMTEVYDNA